MNTIIYFVIIIFSIRVIYLIYLLLLAKRYFKKYQYYINNPKDWFIEENKQRIVTLFEKANIKDNFAAFVQPVGLGMAQSGQFSVFQNLANRREDVAQTVYIMFRETISVFRGKIFDTINPLYWLETIIYFPKTVLKSLGVNNVTLIKSLQVIYWILGLTSALIGIIFNKEFRSWLISISK